MTVHFFILFNIGQAIKFIKKENILLIFVDKCDIITHKHMARLCACVSQALTKMSGTIVCYNTI